MRSRIAVALLLPLSLVAPSSAAAEPPVAPVGVMPTAVEGFGTSAAEVRQQVNSKLRSVLGAGCVVLQAGAGCAAPLDATLYARCIAAAVAASEAEFEEVAQVVLRRAGPQHSTMTLRIFDLDGLVQRELQADIVDADSLHATDALLRKVFDPARYRGEVFIQGVPEGAEFLVDGLPLAQTRAHLSVGKHVLDVVQPHRIDTVPFQVAFERTTEIVLAPPAPAPAWLAGTMAAAGMFAIGVAALYLATTQDQQ